MSFEKKPNYKFEDLIEIMKLLRAPNGCPWDKEQTQIYIYEFVPNPSF